MKRLIEYVPEDHPALAYMRGVLDGSIPACGSIINSVKRSCRDHRDGPERGLFFSVDRAIYVIRYARLCKHSKGEWAGQRFEHAPWQLFVTSELFGWTWKETGFRRFKTAFIEIPKKNGKSTYLAMIGVYMMHGDGENAPEVYALAGQRDQAKIVFNEAQRMVKQSQDLRDEVTVYQHNMHINATNAVFEPLASDVDTIDGRNPHCNIVDELHRHKSRGLWDLVENTMVARRQPLTIAITTAGWDVTSVCYEQHQYALKVLDGVSKNDTYFCYLATPDKGADWRDEDLWRKVNPNMNISVKLKEMHEVAKKARVTPGQQNSFRRYRLNEWTEQADRWIGKEQWDACNKRVDVETLKGQRCWGGLDLALTFDMSATCLLFEVGDLMVVKMRFYVPEDNISQRVHNDRLPYDEWVAEGWLIATPGNVTDFDYIRKDILQDFDDYDIESYGYDPYKATQLATQLQDNGVPMVEVRQGPPSLSEPMQKLEAAISSGALVHNNHPILSWNASNIVTRKNVNGDIAPDKAKSQEKIDGLVAVIIALNRKVGSSNPKRSIYEDRMPIVISI